MIFVTLKNKQCISIQKIITKRCYKRFNVNNFRADMLARFESVMTETDDCNSLWNLWYENFLDVCNTPAPFRSFRVKAKQCPWITSEIRELMSQRDKTLKLANDTKSPSLMMKYRYLRNSITTLLRKAKQKYYHDRINNSSGNSKSMWKVLRSALNNTHHKNDISSDKADSFNEYFINVGCKNNDFFTDNQSEEVFNIKQCTEIFKFLLCLIILY